MWLQIVFVYAICGFRAEDAYSIKKSTHPETGTSGLHHLSPPLSPLSPLHLVRSRSDLPSDTHTYRRILCISFYFLGSLSRLPFSQFSLSLSLGSLSLFRFSLSRFSRFSFSLGSLSLSVLVRFFSPRCLCPASPVRLVLSG